MDINDNLKLERLKILAERQKYFTDLSKDTFMYFTKIFVSLTAGTIAFFTFKEKLTIEFSTLSDLVFGIAVLVTIIGILSILQIVFCLVRWYGYRKEEHKITPDCPQPEKWAWLFEGFYSMAIIASLFFIWYGESRLSKVLINDDLTSSGSIHKEDIYVSDNTRTEIQNDEICKIYRRIKNIED